MNRRTTGQSSVRQTTALGHVFFVSDHTVTTWGTDILWSFFPSASRTINHTRRKTTRTSVFYDVPSRFPTIELTDCNKRRTDLSLYMVNDPTNNCRTNDVCWVKANTRIPSGGYSRPMRRLFDTSHLVCGIALTDWLDWEIFPKNHRPLV